MIAAGPITKTIVFSRIQACKLRNDIYVRFLEMPSFVRHFYTYRCCALALTVSCAAATNLAKKEALLEYFPAIFWLDGPSVSPILSFHNKFII